MQLERIYEKLMIPETEDRVILDGKEYSAKVGKHSIWIPELELKLPFQYNGHFVEYYHWSRGQHAERIKNFTFGTELPYAMSSLYNIVEEWAIFYLLAKRKLAPPIGGFVFFKNILSTFPKDVMRCDPKGGYGFFMRDASKLDKKSFSPDYFKQEFVSSGILYCSETALGDICEEGRNNHINGYIVDIRRSIQDAIHLRKLPGLDEIATDTYLTSICKEIFYQDDPGKLKERIAVYGQFPFKQRNKPYQSYWLRNEYVEGARATEERLSLMGIPTELPPETSVLDLGCCIGAICQGMYLRGARDILGLEYQLEYLACARDLARYNGHQISYLQYDLSDREQLDKVIAHLNKYFPNGIDYVFALAIYKHIGLDNLLYLLENISFRNLYVESSSVESVKTTGHAKECNKQLNKRWKTKFLGYTTDRSKRAIWYCEGGEK